MITLALSGFSGVVVVSSGSPVVVVDDEGSVVLEDPVPSVVEVESVVLDVWSFVVVDPESGMVLDGDGSVVDTPLVVVDSPTVTVGAKRTVVVDELGWMVGPPSLGPVVVVVSAATIGRVVVVNPGSRPAAPADRCAVGVEVARSWAVPPTSMAMEEVVDNTGVGSGASVVVAEGTYAATAPERTWSAR